MYQNPHAIRAGEKLTPEELLDRYLKWQDFVNSNKSYKRAPQCDPDLHQSHLCCTDHLLESSEYDAFFRYFFHLDMTSSHENGFSAQSIREMIKKLNLKVDLALLDKVY